MQLDLQICKTLMHSRNLFACKPADSRRNDPLGSAVSGKVACFVKLVLAEASPNRIVDFDPLGLGHLIQARLASP